MRAGILVMVMVCLTDGKIPKCSVATVITAAKLSKASVSCPAFMDGKSKILYQLFFNNRTMNKLQIIQELGSDELFSGQFEVTVYDSGVYTCRMDAYYPPPKTVHCLVTEVLVGESLPTINETVPVANQSFPIRTSIIPEEVMWVGCGVLLVYSLSITCISTGLWRKMKRLEDDTNVYINTKAGARKKSGKA